MPRYVAFLRAINVGGHVVRMEQLRRLFSSMGFSDVETFIASGNVIFTSPLTDTSALERSIEASLNQALGYEVATFVRSAAELAAIAAHQPFSRDPAAEGGAIHVIFLATPLAPAARRQLLALSNEADEFAVEGREVYWCRRGKMMESTVPGPAMGRTLGGPATARNRNTVVRLTAKLTPPSDIPRKR